MSYFFYVILVRILIQGNIAHLELAPHPFSPNLKTSQVAICVRMQVPGQVDRCRPGTLC